jgi:hypothetical protein
MERGKLFISFCNTEAVKYIDDIEFRINAGLA